MAYDPLDFHNHLKYRPRTFITLLMARLFWILLNLSQQTSSIEEAHAFLTNTSSKSQHDPDTQISFSKSILHQQKIIVISIPLRW